MSCPVIMIGYVDRSAGGLLGMKETHGKELRDVTAMIGTRSNCAHTLMIKSPIAVSNIPCLLNYSASCNFLLTLTSKES